MPNEQTCADALDQSYAWGSKLCQAARLERERHRPAAVHGCVWTRYTVYSGQAGRLGSSADHMGADAEDAGVCRMTRRRPLNPHDQGVARHRRYEKHGKQRGCIHR